MPSNHPDDEAAAIAEEHRWDGPPDDDEAVDPRDLPGSRDPAIMALVRADRAASVELQRYWARRDAHRRGAL